MAQMADIAFLGTGLMGAPMARRLLAAGHRVTVWNRTPAKAEALAGDGARVAPNPADAVADAAIVITIVSDAAAVTDLYFTQGAVQAARGGALFIDMSSIQPSVARDLAARLADAGRRAIDAPVSGGTPGAEAGSLAIMAGGGEDDIEQARPVLEAMGQVTRVGPHGAGQLAKLCNQAIVAISIGAVSEALYLAEKGGADPAAVREAIRGGFAESRILDLHGARIVARDWRPGGPSTLQLKDLDNVLAAAQEAGVDLPLSRQMRERYHSLVHELGGADLDHSALYLELEARNLAST
ncbi:2-hydroxy-3-oxopropionate reductase [Breoghania corrubedonensis]|uniref:2-hydroxy-3-oxopropionate reductase n=1 Tax=Breoghania corrubedonensis TaxID=665038 RepID=A0A2T5VD91_9HYPH|nr:NAD(P)-dependent oxidoreductase [Breoghania corrubedonensis]PTW61704.1 2-hydroxy-3-oxopropionate reductase [Breoghania corrubedonensis]